MHTPRLLVSADASPFCALRREALVDSPWAFLGAPGDDPASDPDVVAELLEQEENAILATADQTDPSRLLAVAGIYRERRFKCRHRATIWGVYCHPTARGRGHGRAVMTAAIDAARSWPGVEIVALSVSSHSREALSLYQSLGFEAWGTEPDAMRIDGDPFDEIYLLLRL